ncbi:MAG TPA: NADH-quinone oxidoreductase subunit J [Polyangiaceae bacterium]|nr:NADH-quinone oxidoreductase subunit J [Polyangiaceae bacterium]
MTETLGFGVVAACMAISALFVVLSRRLVRAVLWLAVTLVATAALYAMQGASFLAGVQVLVYVGGVVTLMIFGVMVTRRHDGITITLDSTRSGRAAVVALALFGVVAFAVRTTPGLDADVTPPALTTADLGRALLVEHVFAFEVVSFLLLGAIVGAIVIARRKDPSLAPSRKGAAAPDAASPEEAE